MTDASGSVTDTASATVSSMAKIDILLYLA